MSEQPTDEPTEADIEAALRGQELAMMMLEAIDGKPASQGAMINAIGSIVAATFAALTLCDKHRLVEFDNWCAYTRTRIVAEQHGEGETRQ